MTRATETLDRVDWRLLDRQIKLLGRLADDPRLDEGEREQVTGVFEFLAELYEAHDPQPKEPEEPPRQYRGHLYYHDGPGTAKRLLAEVEVVARSPGEAEKQALDEHWDNRLDSAGCFPVIEWAEDEDDFSDGQRIVEAVVIRQSRDENTVAVVEAEVDEDFGDEQASEVHALFGAIQQAVTSWAQRTPEGRAALESSSFDFNVGDLWEHCRDPSLALFLQREGIQRLTVQTHCNEVRHHWDYDDRLFDEAEIAR